MFLILLLAAIDGEQEVDEGPEVVQPPKFVLRFFQRHAFTYFAEDGTKANIRYSVFVPKPMEPGKKYPLLVWLHGKGQRGIDNTAQLRHLDETVMPRASKDAYPLFVLAPQCNVDIEWSGQNPKTGKNILAGESGKDMLNLTSDLIDQMIAEHPIDSNRIVLVGLSTGGSAAWEMAERYPNKFAAVMPFGSSPSNDLDLDKLRHVKIWAFHSPVDRFIRPDGVRNMISRLKAVGAPIALTYACDNQSLDDEAMNHFCFRTPFEEYDLFSWILAQDLSKNSPGPGVIQWSKRLRWSYLEPRMINLTPFIIGAAITIAILAEMRRRHRLTRGIRSTRDVSTTSGQCT